MIDDKDQKIINILLKSGRESASGISEKLNLSVPTVIDRIKKMQDSDIISGFKAVINYKKIGLDVSALITIISESSEHYTEVVEFSKNMEEVIQCFTTTGNGSHVLIIQTENTRSLETLLRQIQAWPGVMRTETQIILSNYK